MSVPVIFAVDEDEGALRAVERELVDRYSRGYRVICVATEDEAMAHLKTLADAGEDVALVLTASATPWGMGCSARFETPRSRSARAADRVGQLGRRAIPPARSSRRWRDGTSSTT